MIYTMCNINLNELVYYNTKADKCICDPDADVRAYNVFIYIYIHAHASVYVYVLFIECVRLKFLFIQH